MVEFSSIKHTCFGILNLPKNLCIIQHSLSNRFYPYLIKIYKFASNIEHNEWYSTIGTLQNQVWKFYDFKLKVTCNSKSILNQALGILLWLNRWGWQSLNLDEYRRSQYFAVVLEKKICFVFILKEFQCFQLFHLKTC